jgi:GT2 family glycosyltransferase
MKVIVGIVTVLYNSDDVLPGFFESMACQQGLNYRLYVIDNSANDSGSRLSRSLAEHYGIVAEVIFNNENVGVARGNNQGIELAQRDNCDYVLLANNDIEFSDPDLISGMMAFSSAHQSGAVVPKIYYHNDPNRIWCAGGRFSLYSATTPHFGDGELDCGQYDKERPVDYAPTCFMLLPMKIFKAIGVMDERYFVYFDDSDFVWRMKNGGGRLYYWPKGKVWHKVSFSTGGGESLFSLFYCFRNRIFFVRKNYPFFMGLAVQLYILATLLIKSFGFTKEQFNAVRRGLREGWAIKLKEHG